jgi:hypothetical protein
MFLMSAIGITEADACALQGRPVIAPRLYLCPVHLGPAALCVPASERCQGTRVVDGDNLKPRS